MEQFIFTKYNILCFLHFSYSSTKSFILVTKEVNHSKFAAVQFAGGIVLVSIC